MKSKEYWERRAAERMVNYQADAERTANEIGKAYYQSQEYIKSEIDKVFRGFQKGFSLSEEEALDILDPSSNKTAMTVLRDAAMRIADPAEREKALAALSSPAYQYRINRLDAINSNIAATCNSLYRTELKADSSFLSSEIVKAYQNTIFDVQKGTGVSGAFDIIPQSKIDAIMSRNWSGTHYSDRIWNNTNKLAGELKSDLMAGFLTGKSEQQMSAEIAERYQTSFFNARRLVRTECTYVTGQAELHSYTEMGVEEYVFSAVLDGDTSKICRSLNGKKFKVSQAKPGVNYPPMHPFCRSVANAVLPSEEELDDMWGDTADAIGADVDFDEWVKNLEKTPDGKWKYQKPLDKSEESDIIDTYKGKGVTVFPEAEIPQEVVSRVENATKKITSDFKILEKMSEGITFGDVEGGALGINRYTPSTGKDTITLLKNGFANPDTLLERLKADFKNRDSYDTDYIESLVAHEMGHNAHVALALKRAGLEYGKPLSTIEHELFKTEFTKIQQEIYEAAFTDESFSELQKICVEQLGSMTYCNADELIAQSFGNYYYGSVKSSVGEKIVKYFKKGLK